MCMNKENIHIQDSVEIEATMALKLELYLLILRFFQLHPMISRFVLSPVFLL